MERRESNLKQHADFGTQDESFINPLKLILFLFIGQESGENILIILRVWGLEGREDGKHYAFLY